MLGVHCSCTCLRWKISRNVFLGHVGRWVFHISPYHGGYLQPPSPLNLLEFLGIILQYLILAFATSKMELFVTKNRSWLAGSIVGCCYIELCLECDGAPRSNSEIYSKFTLWQQSIPSTIYMFKIPMCQIYLELTKKTPEQNLVFPLLILNIVCTLFYC